MALAKACPACHAIPMAGYCSLVGCPMAPRGDWGRLSDIAVIHRALDNEQVLENLKALNAEYERLEEQRAALEEKFAESYADMIEIAEARVRAHAAARVANRALNAAIMAALHEVAAAARDALG